jgi:hypothetical protein
MSGRWLVLVKSCVALCPWAVDCVIKASEEAPLEEKKNGQNISSAFVGLRAIDKVLVVDRHSNKSNQ